MPTSVALGHRYRLARHECRSSRCEHKVTEGGDGTEGQAMRAPFAVAPERQAIMAAVFSASGLSALPFTFIATTCCRAQNAANLHA